jgi:hypothetical protein
MKWRHVLIVAVALLAISAQPAASANASAVASEHTTFGTGSQGEPAPTTLTNMTVEGSGESASVSFSAGFSDEFDDEPADSGTPEAWTLTQSGFDTNEVTTARARSGSQSWHAQSSSGAAIISRDFAEASTDAVEVSIYAVSGQVGFDLESGSDTAVTVAVRNGDLEYYDGSSYQTIATAVDNGEWVDLRIVDYDASSNTFGVEWATSNGESGSASGLSFRQDTSGGYDTIDLVASNGEGYYDSIGGGAADTGQYLGAPHDAEHIQTGYANLTLQNTEATITWQEDGDGDGSWTNVSSATVSTTTNVTQDLSGTTSDRWRVRVDVEATGDPPTAEIHDEGLLFESSSPTLSDSEPPDGMQIQNATGNVSINVSDADFPLAQGDNVTVSATDDEGNSLGSTTLTSNGTASFSYSSDAGENTIQWTATDEYGHTGTFTQTFETPATLEVRNESDPDSIVQTQTNITATFFGADGETVIERPSADGTFNLSGLPADAEYVVSVDAEGYRTRQTIITSLYDQQNVYVLPQNASAATIEFQLNDQTGRFPSEDTTLFVEMPLRVNNSTTYKTVFADQFGATNARRVVLRDNTRYRLKVRNGQGETRVLESYTTAGDAIAPLTIGQVQVSGEIGDRGVAFEATVVETDTGRALRVVYRDPEQLTDEVEIGVEYNDSAYVPNTTGTAGYGRYITTIPISNSTPDNATFNVTYAALRDGATIYGQTQAGAVGELDFGVASLPLSLLGWMLTIGLTSMVIIRTPRLAPATGTATASMLTIAGVLAIPAPALGISGAISVLAVAGRGGGQ